MKKQPLKSGVYAVVKVKPKQVSTLTKLSRTLKKLEKKTFFDRLADKQAAPDPGNKYSAIYPEINKLGTLISKFEVSNKESDLLTAKETCTLLNISQSTLQRYQKQGVIRGKSLVSGGRMYYSRKAILKQLNR